MPSRFTAFGSASVVGLLCACSAAGGSGEPPVQGNAPATGPGVSAPSGPQAPSPQTTGIQIAAPRAGASWAAGSFHWLGWTGDVQNARIEVSLDGATWSAVVSDKVDGKRVRWQVPKTTSTTARFRAVSGGLVSPEVAIALVASQESRYTWTRQSVEAGWVWRDGAALENLDGTLHLLGGWNPFAFTDDPTAENYMTTNEVWTSRDGASWRLSSLAPWEARHTFGHAQLGGRLFILGGDALHSHYQPDVWSTADGTTWSLETARAPWGDRVLHRAMAHAGALWVMGGQTMPDLVSETVEAPTFHDDVWRSTDGKTWTRVLEHAPWPARGAVDGSSVFMGAMWMLGGGTYDQLKAPIRKTYSDAWSSVDGVTWTAHADPPWPAREYHAVAVFDGRMWVLGGYDPATDTDLSDVWYTADGENWYEQPNALWPARHAPAVAVTPTGLWITAGDAGDTAVYMLAKGSVVD